MIRQKVEQKTATIVDGVRFDDIHIQDLTSEFGGAYETWQTVKYTKTIPPDLPGALLETFLAFEEAEAELREAEWQREKSRSR